MNDMHSAAESRRFEGMIIIDSRQLVSMFRYIGGWPSSDERLPDPSCAVLDCIQELPKHVTTKHYLTTPAWDTHGMPPPPTINELLILACSTILQLRKGGLFMPTG